MFTRDELAALTLGARFVKAWGGARLALAAEEALTKIEAVLPEREKSVARDVNLFAMAYDLPDNARQVVDHLELAIRGRHRVSVAYEALGGDRTDRVLRPLGLYHWGKVWTLAAWCELRGDFRNFRADRIAAIADCGDTFRDEAGKTLRDFLRRMAEAGVPGIDPRP
jgi:predicted DNA-binding transcriptional regulator YafY